MIQCQGCTCAGWLWEGEGGLGDHQPGVYVPLKALFLVFNWAFSIVNLAHAKGLFKIIFGHKCFVSVRIDFQIFCNTLYSFWFANRQHDHYFLVVFQKSAFEKCSF